jgi:hypothetical protein
MTTEVKSYYDSEVQMGVRELATLLSQVGEIRMLHDNGAATHFVYIASFGANRYEVGTLVLDAVDQTMMVFHRQTEEGITDARKVLAERVTRGY